MALTSVYYDGVVTETDRAKNRTGAADYGVYGVGDFEVKAHPSIPYAVLVKAGRAHGHGVTDKASIDQVVQCDTLASGTRWDLIVVRRNWQPALGGPSTLAVVQGGSVAEIPDGRKVGPGVEDDQPIALVKWQGGLSAPAQIIDLRVWAANGGLYAKEDLVRSYLSGVGTSINIAGTRWSYELLSNSVPGWTRSASRRHATFNAVAGGNNGATVGGAEWGFGEFYQVPELQFNNTFASPGGESRIRIVEPGVYAVIAKASSFQNPGYFYLSIKNSTNNLTYSDSSNGGGPVPTWGVTATHPGLLFTSPGEILLGLKTTNSVGVKVVVNVIKISD